MSETTTGTGPRRTDTVGSGTATVTYDVHGDLAQATPERPALFLIGSPMDAVGFTTLRSHFTDRPVVTYDPRGAGRNPTDTTSITAEEHADDLHQVIEALGAGPVDLFAQQRWGSQRARARGDAPRGRTPRGGARAADGSTAA